MTTDFRALCAELVRAWDVTSDFDYNDFGNSVKSIVNRARAALADEPAVPEVVGSEWQPCVKLPITVHVREQRPGEQHVLTREGITPVQPDDLIMLGVDGEEYPIGRELFQRTYSMGSADEPAVPEGKKPTRDELWELWLRLNNELPDRPAAVAEFWEHAQIDARARAVLARWGNPAPTPPADASQLSDGYHTFAELYEHRYSLMLALMRALPRICWFSRRHADGELPFGSDDWFIVGAELPGAPITYHLPAALYSLAQKTGALELPAGRPWDGHSAADVVHRLRDWAIEPAPPADGEVAELVEMLKGIAYWRLHGTDKPTPFDIRQADRLDRAAELLQRQCLDPLPARAAAVPEAAGWHHQQGIPGQLAG